MQQDCEIIVKRCKSYGMIENIEVVLLGGMKFQIMEKKWVNLMSFNEVKCEIVSEGKGGGPMAPSNVVYQQCKYT